MRYLCVLLILAGCAAERDSGELFGPVAESMLVVDALLLVDQGLPPVYVRRSLAPDQTYSRQVAAVAGARVQVLQGEQVYDYRADPDSAGLYWPPDGAPRVMENTQYRLQVEVDGHQVRGQTTTPARLRIRESVLVDEETLEVVRSLKSFAEAGEGVYGAPENQLVYLDDLLEARIDTVDVQAYQIALFSLDPESDFVITADFLEDDDFEEFEREGASPPLAVQDGIVRLPWFAVAFQGCYLVKIYALDHNWFEYARSSPDENEGGFAGGLAGDNFERPLFQLEGGIGLFGSASVDSLGFFVLPQAEDE